VGQLKIVFSGPVCSGKTTAVATISDILPATTEKHTSDHNRALKDDTTVAMDFGLLKLDNGQEVYLYGTPGQRRFDFMWEIISKGAIGAVILIDNTAAAPLEDLSYFLGAFESLIESSALAVGVTRMDLKQSPTIADYHRVQKERCSNFPLFEVDAREAADVTTLIQAMLCSLDPGAGLGETPPSDSPGQREPARDRAPH